MTPYETDKIVTTTDPDEIVEIGIPGRCQLELIYALNTSGGEVTFTAYNRLFTGPQVSIRGITVVDPLSSPSRIVVLVAPEALLVRAGDIVTIEGSGGFASIADDGGYDGDHRVLSVEKSTVVEDLRDGIWKIFLDSAFDGELGPVGTIKLNIPENEQTLYQVDVPATGTPEAELISQLAYVNRDPLGNRNIGVKRKIYIKFADAGTYRVVLRCRESIGI